LGKDRQLSQSHADDQRSQQAWLARKKIIIIIIVRSARFDPYIGMKTKDRIIQIRISTVPESTLWISKLDVATTRKEIYQLQNSIYNIPGIREMNRGEAWETFGYTYQINVRTARFDPLRKVS